MKKPVTPGRKPKGKAKNAKPKQAEKAASKAKLIGKGVNPTTAAHVTGDGEDLTAEQIAERRINWQKTLPKG